MFRKYTADIIITDKLPEKHSIRYTDFPFFRKEVNYMWVPDDDKFKLYFEQPFNSINIKKLSIAGDNVRIQSEQTTMIITIRRDWFTDINWNNYQYGKVSIFYDDNKKEDFYFWIWNITNSEENLIDINLECVIDIIPSFYNNIIKQEYATTIIRRSFNIKTQNNPLLTRERERRIERLSWNISCDSLCQGERVFTRLYNINTQREVVDVPSAGEQKAWGDLIPIYGSFIYNDPQDKKGTLITTDLYSYNNPQSRYISPTSISLPPLFLNNIKTKLAVHKKVTTDPIIFNNLLDVKQIIYNEWIGKEIKEIINDENGAKDILLLSLHNGKTIEQSRVGLYGICPLTVSDAYNNIPYHHLQLHTKYTILSNQDDMGEINSTYVFLEGYDYVTGSSYDGIYTWVSSIPIKMVSRNTTDVVMYDVYPTQWTVNAYLNKLDYQLSKTWDVKPVLSFASWIKLYAEENALSLYLRTNQEQRKLQKQQARNNYISGALTAILSGAVAGAVAGTTVLPVIGTVTGAIIGIMLGATGFLAKEHVLSNTYEEQEQARRKDIQTNFSPSIPSELAGDFTFYDQHDLSDIHPLGVSILIMTPYGWEANVTFSPKGGGMDYNDSERLLNNLIQYGEKTNRPFTNFNFFDFVAKNKTDEDIFFIMSESSRSIKPPRWSNIFSNLDDIFAKVIETGIRFHYETD